MKQDDEIVVYESSDESSSVIIQEPIYHHFKNYVPEPDTKCVEAYPARKFLTNFLIFIGAIQIINIGIVIYYFM